MGKHTDKHSKNKKRKAWEVSRESLYAIIPILLSLLVGAFYLGGYFMEAKKDREMTHWENEIEAQHRQEIANKEKEKDEWREKCFQLMVERTGTKGRSP